MTSSAAKIAIYKAQVDAYIAQMGRYNYNMNAEVSPQANPPMITTLLQDLPVWINEMTLNGVEVCFMGFGHELGAIPRTIRRIRRTDIGFDVLFDKPISPKGNCTIDSMGLFRYPGDALPYFTGAISITMPDIQKGGTFIVDSVRFSII